MRSRSGAPRRGARGLGAPPDTDAIRLPLPAARIRHSLMGAIRRRNESTLFSAKLCDTKEGLQAFHGLGISFADMTELSGGCVVLGA